MARSSAKVGKSETLTIRLDPKTRFILEYLSRLNGQTITTVVERALVSAAQQQSVSDPDYPSQPDGWQFFWDVSDGVRALRMARREEFFPTYEEDRRLAFAIEHWPFFWTDKARKTHARTYIDILWPRIDEFVQMHEDNRQTSYFATGEAMQTAIRSAGVRPPTWPPVDEKPASRGGGRPTSDLDDEIPF